MSQLEALLRRRQGNPFQAPSVLPRNVDPRTGAIWEQPVDPGFTPPQTGIPQNVDAGFVPATAPQTPALNQTIDPSMLVRPRTAIINPMAPPPEYVSTGMESRVRETAPPSNLERQQSYVSELGRVPPEKISRKRAALEAVRTAILSSGGDPYRMLAAAGTAAVGGALTPAYQAKQIQARQLGVENEKLGQMMGMEKARVDMDSDRAMTEQRRATIAQMPTKAEQGAERIKLQARSQLLRQLQGMQKYKPGENAKLDAQLEQAGIFADEFDKSKNTLQKIWVKGQLHSFDPKSGALAPVMQDGQPVVDQSKVPVEEGGLWVTPGTALTARATGERFAVTQAKGEARDETVDSREQAERAAKRAAYDADIQTAESELKDVDAQLAGANAPDNYEGSVAAGVSSGQSGGMKRAQLIARKKELGDQIRRAKGQRDAIVDLPPRVAPSAAPTSQKSQWQQYVDTYFGGDEAKAKAHQKR